MRPANLSVACCALVFGVAGGLGLANCGGVRATNAGPEDAAVFGDSGEGIPGGAAMGTCR